tara:strand:- start:4990 stop:5109 length:120 start_codon:yes stop_codon:yes gene_type:complete
VEISIINFLQTDPLASVSQKDLEVKKVILKLSLLRKMLN